MRGYFNQQGIDSSEWSISSRADCTTIHVAGIVCISGEVMEDEEINETWKKMSEVTPETLLRRMTANLCIEFETEMCSYSKRG